MTWLLTGDWLLGWQAVYVQLIMICVAVGYYSGRVSVKPWGLWLDGKPWGRKRFWTRSGAQNHADECNHVRTVLGLSPLVEVYNRFEPGL